MNKNQFQVSFVPLLRYRYQFDESSYRMMEMMRFTVEEINNSSTLLPEVSLGYEIFDYCSELQNFPSVLSFLSENGSIPVQRYFTKYKPKIVAVVGPYGSTRTMTVAPLFTLDLIPMVRKHLLFSWLKLNQLIISTAVCLTFFSIFSWL